MGRLIKLYDIDEFSKVKAIPDASINETILSNVRNLDEKSEMERFIREILFDPNETPHGPTEIADILTSHVHVRGDRRLASFVLKGKSFQRVSSRVVTHQFVKLRQVPSLGLIVFGAVGNIQDDAQRDFVQIAFDAECDYLIIDAQDFARLFITYGNICPKDGLPYDNTGTCEKGHVRDKGLTLEMKVGEKVRYDIMDLKDESYPGAKRYSATILLDRHYPRDLLRTIIKKATEEIKTRKYYRDERMKAWWGETPAHVVWLSIAFDVEDIQNVNWFCSTCWIDPSLEEVFRPAGLKGNEILGDITLLWNDDYEQRKRFFESQYGTKEEVLEAILPILEEMLELARQGINYSEDFQTGNISESVFISKMKQMEPRVTELYNQSGNISTPPPECEDYHQACENVFATIHNMFFYFSEGGLKRWNDQKRNRLLQYAIKTFNEDRTRLELEDKKLS